VEDRLTSLINQPILQLEQLLLRQQITGIKQRIVKSVRENKFKHSVFQKTWRKTV